MNVGSYFGYIGMGQYLNGIAAGHATKTKKLGFVAAKPIPQVLLNINSFLLGARAVDPAITLQVIFTGEWSLAVKEAEATNALADAGCDVITCHVDGPKVVMETAAGRGAYVCGYHANQSSLAPALSLTGAEWNWASGAEFVRAFLEDDAYPNLKRGGFREDMVALSPFGAAVPQEVRDEVMAAKQGFIDDSLQLYAGPIVDNQGNVIVPDGEVRSNDDVPFKLGIDWFVEGTIG